VEEKEDEATTKTERGKTMKEEEQKFHNLNPWPYNLPLNLAFVRRVLTGGRGPCFKVTPYVTGYEGANGAHEISGKKCTKSERRFLKKVTTWDTQA
jgi:hypothetical protein